MSSVNKVILVGRLGNDPEVKYTPNGTAVCSIGLATDNPARRDDRDQKPAPEWHKLVVWDKQAESLAKYKRKGDQVYIEGRLQTRSWDDKQSGQKRSVTEIQVSNVVFIGGRQDGQGRDDRGGNEPNRDDRGSDRGQQSQRGGGRDGGQQNSRDRNDSPRGGQAQGNGGYGGGRGGYNPEEEELPPSTFSEDDDIPF